jgi:hypothetical protein
MRALVLVACAGCFGTLGQRGHRAPAGLAFCEPDAIAIDTLDASGAVARTVIARCDAHDAVTISDTDGFRRRLHGDYVRDAWTLAGSASLARCAPATGPGPRYRITIVGDDDVESATCALGADATFDAILGAVMGLRHRPPMTWIDSPAVSSR